MATISAMPAYSDKPPARLSEESAVRTSEDSTAHHPDDFIPLHLDDPLALRSDGSKPRTGWFSRTRVIWLSIAAAVGLLGIVLYSLVFSPGADQASASNWLGSPATTPTSTFDAPNDDFVLERPGKTLVAPVDPLPTENPYLDDFYDRQDRVYTQNLVVATLVRENTSWIEEELGDLIGPGNPISVIRYFVDNDTAPFHASANKGHEAMVYLDYLIAFYDSLPDVSIFIHAHQSSWHNLRLLDKSTSKMIRHYNPDKVIREGYFNLHCEWEPGCPGNLMLHSDRYDADGKELPVFIEEFPQMFPDDILPERLSQPCCAQFAVSRDQIRTVPKATYERLRNWLYDTPLFDGFSGRLFEYVWQYLFVHSPTWCPDEQLCLCDGYSICFADWRVYQVYKDLERVATAYTEELIMWRDREKAHKLSIENNVPSSDRIDPPEPGRDKFFEKMLGEVGEEMRKMKDEAFAIGSDRERRLQVLNDSWREALVHPGRPS